MGGNAGKNGVGQGLNGTSCRFSLNCVHTTIVLALEGNLWPTGFRVWHPIAGSLPTIWTWLLNIMEYTSFNFGFASHCNGSKLLYFKVLDFTCDSNYSFKNKVIVVLIFSGITIYLNSTKIIILVSYFKAQY